MPKYVLQVSPDKKEFGIIYVDLGNVRSVKSEDLRIPRAFGDKPILAVRMVLDHVIPPNGDEYYTEHSISAIEDELTYWKAGTVTVVRSRLEIPTRFPLPVHLYRHQQGKKEWHNYGREVSDRLFIFTLFDCLFTLIATLSLRICSGV